MSLVVKLLPNKYSQIIFLNFVVEPWPNDFHPAVRNQPFDSRELAYQTGESVQCTTSPRIKSFVPPMVFAMAIPKIRELNCFPTEAGSGLDHPGIHRLIGILGRLHMPQLIWRNEHRL